VPNRRTGIVRRSMTAMLCQEQSICLKSKVCPTNPGQVDYNPLAGVTSYDPLLETAFVHIATDRSAHGQNSGGGDRAATMPTLHPDHGASAVQAVSSGCVLDQMGRWPRPQGAERFARGSQNADAPVAARFRRAPSHGRTARVLAVRNLGCESCFGRAVHIICNWPPCNSVDVRLCIASKRGITTPSCP
jgi:hypothetical protein